MEALISQRRPLAVHRMAQVSDALEIRIPRLGSHKPGMKLTTVPLGNSIRCADYARHGFAAP
jgi:hypothetical protein